MSLYWILGLISDKIRRSLSYRMKFLSGEDVDNSFQLERTLELQTFSSAKCENTKSRIAKCSGCKLFLKFGKGDMGAV